MLEEAGYVRLRENEEWKLVKGGKYYTERNDSSVIAFAIPTETVKGFHMAAAHSDSPCFKVKEKPELTVEDHYMRLNTEKYGGMIAFHLDGQTALRSRQTGGARNGWHPEQTGQY